MKALAAALIAVPAIACSAPSANTAVVLALKEYRQCVMDKAIGYANTKELPNDIATAAMSACHEKAYAYQETAGEHYRQETGFDPTNFQGKILGEVDPMIRGDAVRSVLETRYSKGNSK